MGLLQDQRFKFNSLLFIALNLVGCAHQPGVLEAPAEPKSPSHQTLKQWDRTVSITPASAPDLYARMRLGYRLNLSSHHPKVQQHIRWIQQHPNYLKQLTVRSEPYLYYILQSLEAEQMPLEIALLPMVESAYDPFAYSRGRAAGLWQFIPSTGKLYGLDQNWWYEGRRDIRGSTQAAVRFLKRLNTLFDGDWLLALAAYNSGPGTVLNAIKRNKKRGEPTDFWSLKLPKETREYVPKLIALANIVKHPGAYNMQLRPVANQPYFEVVDIGGQMDLAKAAHMAKISAKALYQLNPAFNQWATHPKGPHELLLPIAKVNEFKQALANIDPNERVRWQRYRIQPGDNLGAIAKAHRTTISVIKQTNQLRSHHIRAGKTLLIPTASEAGQVYTLSKQQRLQALQNRARAGQYKRLYRVKPGDSLWSIAKAHKVTVSKLARWNNLAPGDTLRAKQSLAIWIPTTKNPSSGIIKKVIYQVRTGDSLAQIADKFSVRVGDLASWNQLQKHKYIHPGQKLVVYVDVTQLKS